MREDLENSSGLSFNPANTDCHHNSIYLTLL